MKNRPATHSIFRFILFATFLLVLTGPLFSVAANDDWPHWRGPNRNHISSETGLLKSWPDAGPKRVWVNDNAGLGYAGFSIVGKRLFTMGLEENEEFALCLDANDGSELWRTGIGKRYKNRWGDGPRSTPSVDGDQVYFMTAQGDLACLNLATGKKVWSVSMKDFGGSVPRWGYAESPLVDGDRVVCTPGGNQGAIVALDKKTGKKIWQTKPITRFLEDGSETSAANAHYSSVLPVNWNNQRQYIQLTVLAVVGIDAENGDVLWQVDWPGRTAVIPSPSFKNGKVYVTSGYGAGSKHLEIGSGNAVEELWFSKAMQNHHGSVIQVGDFFYGSSSKSFVCQDESDGSMKWNDRSIKKGALGYADDRFYHIQESDGKVLLIEANGNSHDIKGSFVLSPQSKRRKQSGKIWVHPVIANGKLYLRDQEFIYCFDVKK